MSGPHDGSPKAGDEPNQTRIHRDQDQQESQDQKSAEDAEGPDATVAAAAAAAAAEVEAGPAAAKEETTAAAAVVDSDSEDDGNPTQWVQSQWIESKRQHEQKRAAEEQRLLAVRLQLSSRPILAFMAVSHTAVGPRIRRIS